MKHAVSISTAGNGLLLALSATSRLTLVDKLRLKPYIQLHIHPDLSGRNSVVECQLPKLDVAGSTPVARSKLLKSNYKVPKSMAIDRLTKVAGKTTTQTAT